MKALLALIMVLSSTLSFASVYPPAITGAAVFCGDENGMIAINTREEKAWLSTWGSFNGIRLQDVNVQNARCPGCFDLKARYDNKLITLTVRYHKTAVGTMSTERESETLNFKCSETNKKPTF